MNGASSIDSLRFRPSVAADVLKDLGVKPTDGNIAKLVEACSTKAKSDQYLNRTELESAADKLWGQGKVNKKYVPTRSIDWALDNTRVPKAVNDVYDLYMLPNGQLRSRPNQVPLTGVGLRATAKSIGGTQNMYGGYDFKLGGTEKFGNAKWVNASLADVVAALHKGKKAETLLNSLKAKNIDVTSPRDLMLFTGSKHKEPIIMGFSYNASARSIFTVCEETQTFDFGRGAGVITVKKPVIYLYPEKKTTVQVHVDIDGHFIAQYPKAEGNRWEVIATPDGTLFEPKSERRFSYLFWEAKSPAHWELDSRRAHCVAREDVETFLEKASGRFGLNDKERTDFITYWVAALTQKPYALIQFVDEAEYEARVRMKVTPEPDATIRLFMIFRGLDQAVNAGSPALPLKKRGRFTVVEWGGANLDE